VLSEDLGVFDQLEVWKGGLKTAFAWERFQELGGDSPDTREFDAVLFKETLNVRAVGISGI
jgi:hypothetical protein